MEAADRVTEMLEIRGVKVRLREDISLDHIEEGETGVRVPERGGRGVDADAVLIATGRKPNSEGFGLKALGIEDSSFLKVDQSMRLANPRLYAVRSFIDPEPTFVKIIVDAGTRHLLGCLVVGDHASVIVNIATIAMRSGLSVDKFRQIPLSQPAASEALMSTLRKLG
jgi:pyruvate/2-oxoglutarate dehydrogenase complex dihydrolipoamide dehydrogenase (E3) component